MKTNKIFLTMLLVLASAPAHAVPQRLFRDLKLPSQQMVEKQTITNPAAAGTTDVLSSHAGNTSAAAASTSTFVAQPDVARNLVVTAGTSAADVADCFVTVSGKNIHGVSMSERFHFSAGGLGSAVGELAFKTVSSVSWPAGCETGAFAATWSIGYGEKLGVSHCMSSPGHILFSTLNGAKEATAPTMVVHAGNTVAGVTADFNGTMNGSNDFELFYFQNYQCP